MPATERSTGSQTLTVVTPVNAETFHVREWRNIVNAWPGWSEPPIAEIGPASELELDERARLAVFVDAREGIDRAILRVMDRCRERFVPVVIRCDAKAHGRALEDGAETMVVDTECPPAEIAVLLAGLIKRQELVLALGTEIGALQRFHTGVRGEIDKINEELRLASTMQRDFLPMEFPSYEGYDLASMFRPCGCVSGDIYDIREIDESRVCVLIADAVGHGVPAALMTMVIAKSVGHAIETQQAQGDVDPSHVLGELNRDLTGRGLDSSRFATAVCGIVDTRAHTIRIASAGHPHPLLIRPDGEITRLPCEGCLLGVFEDAEYESCEHPIGPGEALVLYSDGFEVAFPAGARSDGSAPNTHYLDHFSKIAGHATRGTLDEALLALAAELDSHRGSLHQQDDLTVVGVSRAA